MDPQKTTSSSPDSEKEMSQDNAVGSTAQSKVTEATGTGVVKPETPASSVVAPDSATAAPIQPLASTSTPSPAPAWPTTPGVAGMPASAVGGAHHPSGKKGLLVALIIAAVVLVLGGGFAAAYFGYIVPNKPDNVLKAALVNEFTKGTVKSEHFDGKISFTDKQSDVTVAGTFTGGATQEGAFEVKGEIDALVTKLTFDVRSVDGSSLYLKVGGLEGVPELLSAYGETEAVAYASILGTINDQWIEINESMLNQMGAATGSFKMTDADRTKIAEAYGKHQFLSVKEKLQNEKISGMDSYHYKVVIDKASFKAFVTALKDAKLDSMKLTQDDIHSLNDALKDVDFNKFPVDVWIAKDTKLIDQVAFSYSDDEASVNVRMTVLDYRPVTVTKPADAKSLLEVISGMFSGQDATLLRELESTGISL